MKINILFILLLCLSFTLSATQIYQLPAIDTGQLKQTAFQSDGPLKYAVANEVKDIYHTKRGHSNIEWFANTDGLMEYTLRLSAKNATSLNVGMTDFFLPPSAELWVYDDNKSVLRGPYTDRFNPQNGLFWIGDVPADHVNLTITVAEPELKYVSFKIAQASSGFYAYWKTPEENGLKSGSCNIDVACPEGEDWQPEISSVGQYSFQTSDGGFVCTGQMINNTAQDGSPYFLTASHCGYTGSTSSEKDSVAASINIIWNYESQSCRTPGSGSSGTPINKGTFNQRQAGSTFVANNPSSDFALLLLNQTPNSSYDIQYTGWDRNDTAFDAGIAIHHPSGHAKRISFENDALIITGYLQNSGGGSTHLRVVDWDEGTTEGGSSGSGLWNSDYRLVGQLHGGYAACGNNDSDWYGRFYQSWANGSTPETRLKDWLDPIDSNQMTLDTSGQCEAPVVNINPPNQLEVGQDAQFTADVVGGSGNYEYTWDLNGDGAADGQGSSITTRYSHGYVGNVTLTVVDDSGCQAVDSRAVIIESPDIQISGDPVLTQMCGNNDGVVDPGEQWRATLQVTNVGSIAANNAYALFAKSRNQSQSGNQDNYGNKYSACDKQFIDISQAANEIPWVKQWTNYPADDMGSADIQLNTSFDHYGEAVSSLVASSNGYLSTNPDAEGVDYSNDCPIPAVADYDAGGRIAPLHDDLQSSTFYHQYFADCPRDSETNGDACEVFTWQGADVIATGTTENTDIQAILYPQTSQWVYQYQGGTVTTTSATIGLQNQAADDALMVGCQQTGLVNINQALCIFNKNHGEPADNLEEFDIATPAPMVNDLAVNQSREVQIDFTVDESATCGVSHSIDYQAGIYNQGFNAGQDQVINFAVGQGGQCQQVTQCDDNNDNTVAPKTGLWWNPDRSGNGLEMHVIDEDRLLYIMYTGRPDGSPVWYTADSDQSAYDLFFNDIYKVTYPGGFDSDDKQFSRVGWSNTYIIDSLNALQVRSIDGQLSAEKLAYQQLDNQITVNEYTGHYYAPQDSGWGQSVITEGRYRVIVSYLYDQEGFPYWTYASGDNDNSALVAGHFNNFCPHCPWVQPDAEAVGGVQIQFSGPSEGVINFYDIVYPMGSQQPQVNWQRTQLPVVNRNALP